MNNEQGFSISKEWKYAKEYLVVQRDKEKRYYLVQGWNKPLNFYFDPITGWPIPTNAIQETKQKAGKELEKILKAFRKDFKVYAETYWDLMPVSTMSGYMPRRVISDLLIQMPNEEFRADLLKYIKEHSWKRLGFNVTPDKQPLWREEVISLWLGRFTRQFYRKFKHKMEYEPVPLGTPCPKHRYR